MKPYYKLYMQRYAYLTFKHITFSFKRASATHTWHVKKFRCLVRNVSTFDRFQKSLGRMRIWHAALCRLRSQVSAAKPRWTSASPAPVSTMARAQTRWAATTASVLQVRWAPASSSIALLSSVRGLRGGKKKKKSVDVAKSPSRGPCGRLGVPWGNSRGD